MLKTNEGAMMCKIIIQYSGKYPRKILTLRSKEKGTKYPCAWVYCSGGGSIKCSKCPIHKLISKGSENTGLVEYHTILKVLKEYDGETTITPLQECVKPPEKLPFDAKKLKKKYYLTVTPLDELADFDGAGVLLNISDPCRYVDCNPPYGGCGKCPLFEEENNDGIYRDEVLAILKKALDDE